MKMLLIIPRIKPANSRGFALPAAIFLMVILAALAAFLVNISVQQQAGQSADIQGSRAYQAARAGIEWGAYDFLRNNACVGANFVPGASLAAFTVTVVCVADAGSTEAGAAVASARITATACNQPAAGVCPPAVPGAGYVERQLSVVVSR